MTPEEDPKPKRKPNALILMELIAARKAYPFRDNEQAGGDVYIADGPSTISRSEWSRWLSAIWWDHSKGKHAIGDDARKTAIDTLEAMAHHGNHVEPVFLRVAPIIEHEDLTGVAIDMGTDTWDAIVVTKNGWSVQPTPVRFRRTPSFGELPDPSRHGTLASLKSLLNLKDEDQQRLVIGFLLGSLNPNGPYPVLGLSGVQGSGKSVTARLIRAIVDPVSGSSGNGLKSLTKDEGSFWATAFNAWMPAYDNVSGITPDTSDMLCRLASNGGRTARKLYTDGESFEQNACRPVILNGMELADRPDLLSRTIPLELPRLEERASEEHLLGQFQKVHPVLLGGLLDALVGILTRIDTLPHIKIDGPRMFDHVRWVTAAEQTLSWAGGAYEALFAAAQDAVLAGSTDGIVWLDPLHDLLDDGGGEWDGGSGQLLRDLRKRAIDDLPDGDHFDKRGWPMTGKGMQNALTRYGEALRSVQIRHTTEWDGHSKSFRHHLRKVAAPVPHVPTAGFAGVAGVDAPVPPPEYRKKEESTATYETTPATPASPALSPTPVRRAKKQTNGYVAPTPPPDPDAAKTWQQVMAEIMESRQKDTPDA